MPQSRPERSARAHLPSERTELFGRAAEVRQIRTWLAEGSRLLTIVGPPGNGKTRLALRVANTLEGDRPVLFVDLSASRSAEDIIAAVAACVGAEISGRSVELDVQRVARALAAREDTLVVLDNFEQVRAYAATTVAVWARSHQILVTSREALMLDGERRFELAPLDDKSASALFFDRAQSAGAIAPDPVLVRKIVAHLDRLPLAIELAAARAGVLSMPDLWERLSQGVGFLRSRQVGVPDRQATLRAAIEWSWALLDQSDRAALRQSAVFSGGMSLTAAEAVLELPGGEIALDALQSLCEKFLLRAETDSFGALRFMPYVSVAEFAREQLDASTDRASTEARHAAHFADVAETWDAGIDGPNRRLLTERFRGELDNMLRAHERSLTASPAHAARLALALQRRALLTLRFAHRVPLLQETLSALPRDQTDLRDRLLVAELYALRLQLAPDHPDIVARLETLPAPAAPTVAADATLLRGILHVDAGRYDESRPFLDRARALAAEHQAHHLELAALDTLGVLRADEGDIAARAILEQAVTSARAHGLRRYEGRSLSHLGLMLHDLGELHEARSCLERAVEIAQEGGEDWFHAHYLLGLATVLIEQGALGLAQDALTRAQDMAIASGDDRASAHTTTVEAVLAALDGKIDEAAEGFSRSRSAMEQGGWWVAAIHNVLEGHLDVARFRQDDDPTHLAQAQHRIDRAPTEASMDVRIAVRLLGAAMGSRGLVVGPDARWFEANGARVELQRRRAMRLLLEALVDAHARRPGEALPLDALQRHGWPGEQMHPESGARRVYVAIGTLRKLGLGDLILTADGGYLLDPAVTVTTP